MDPTGPRGIAKQQYANMRRSLTAFEERVIARYWDDDALVRTSFERFLGSLDWFAEWLLSDDEMSPPSEDLAGQTEDPASRREGEPSADEHEHEHDNEENDEQEHDDQQVHVVSAVDVTFTLPADVQADSVVLCGEFNQWSAGGIRLERDNDGIWRAVVALEPFRSYRYRYLLDGERWENAPHADHYVPNPYGSFDSVIAVEPNPA